MSHFLNELHTEHKLPAPFSIRSTLVQRVIATMLGNFQDGSEPGKIQFGWDGGSMTSSTA
jgi:glucuronate isomerase